MSIEIVEHCEALKPAVEAFNQRMREGGQPWGFYVNPNPDWIPKRSGAEVWREYYLALEDHDAVRGGFVLKPQNWQIRGTKRVVTDWQGPVSEGTINPRFATLAVRLIREMLRLRPALYSWGHGGNEQPMVQILRRMNWLIHETPLCLLVIKPVRFLRRNGYLRKSPSGRLLLDLLAWSGIGSVALHGVHWMLRLSSTKRYATTATEFQEFGPWADELWQRFSDRYTALAIRDASSMNALAPLDGWPPVVRLRIERGGEPVGWTLVMDTSMSGDPRFGNLRVGSIVDCFAAPDDAGDVVHAATSWLKRRGVDIIVSNQAHPQWRHGFRRNGYLLLEGRRLFVASPKLREMLEPFGELARGLHLTNMDGHGPHGL